MGTLSAVRLAPPGRRKGLESRRIRASFGDLDRGRDPRSAVTECLEHIERRLGFFRCDERTLIAPLLQKHLSPARSPEPGSCVLSVDPPQDLPLSSSTAEAASRLRGKVARRSGLCNSARSFDSQPWT